MKIQYGLIEVLIKGYNSHNGMPTSHKINNLKIFGRKYSHSLFGIYKRLITIGSRLRLNIGGADTDLKKEFRTIGDILFEDEDPKSFVDLLSTLTPRFINTLREQIENTSYRRLGQLLGLESALDAKEIKNY